VWAGVDVGARRKGFQVAVIDERGLVRGPENLKSVAEVEDLLARHAPAVIGIDSPRSAALSGEKSRACERDLARGVCGIRYTPDQHAIAHGGSYYGWVRNGLALYEALAVGHRWELAEVFPTASCTRLRGQRGAMSRAGWSAAALDSLGLDGVPAGRLSQDSRDAIIAAWTARLCSTPGAIEWFGEIAVPA
jgi:predicted nuclease with RNAse H fold